MRDIILAEIKRVADANGGKPPGSALFRKETGIIESKWRGIFWARWGDALVDAGYSANAWQQKLDSNAMLEQVAQLIRREGRVPTDSEISMARRRDPRCPSPKTLRGHFSSRANLIEALRSYCVRREGFAEVAALLPEAVASRTTVKDQPAEGWVYLLKSGQHHKIGRSDQLEKRVKKISIALPEATAMIHAIRTDDPSGIEAYWHRRFADRRANGEWFKLSAADVAAFTRRKFQ